MDPWASPWEDEGQASASPTAAQPQLAGSPVKTQTTALPENPTDSLDDDPWAMPFSAETGKTGAWNDLEEAKGSPASWHAEAVPAPTILRESPSQLQWAASQEVHLEARHSSESSWQRPGTISTDYIGYSAWTQTQPTENLWRPQEVLDNTPSGYAGTEMWEDASSKISDKALKPGHNEDQVSAHFKSEQKSAGPSLAYDEIPPQIKTVTEARAEEEKKRKSDVTDSNRPSVPSVDNGGTPDAREGWRMEKSRGASALAGKVGGWISSTVAARKRTDATPPVVSASDEGGMDDKSSKAKAIVDVTPESVLERPSSAAASISSRSLDTSLNLTCFWSRWRKQPATNNQHAPQTDSIAQFPGTPSSAVDSSKLDWLNAQAPVAAPSSSFSTTLQGKSPDTLFDANSSQTGLPRSNAAGFLDLDLFEASTQGVMPAQRRHPATQKAPRIQGESSSLLQEQDTLAMFDSLTVASIDDLHKTTPPRWRLAAQQTAVALDSGDLVDGRADEDDIEAVGRDYRDDDDEEEEEYEGSIFDQRNQRFSDKSTLPELPSRSTMSQPALPHKSHPSTNVPKSSTSSLDAPLRSLSSNSLGTITLKRSSSSASSRATRSTLLPSPASGGETRKTAPLLPPPPPGPASSRTRSPLSPPRPPTSLHPQTDASQLGVLPSSSGPQRQGPALSQGQGMTEDDLAFFEGF